MLVKLCQDVQKRWFFAKSARVFTIVRGRSHQSTRLVFQRAIMDGQELEMSRAQRHDA